MLILNTYALVFRSTKLCQFCYIDMMHWYTGIEWYHGDLSKEVIVNLSKVTKESNVNS